MKKKATTQQQIEQFQAAPQDLVYTAEMKKAVLKATRIALRFHTIETWGEAHLALECFEEVTDAEKNTHDVSLGLFSSRGHYISNGTMDELRPAASFRELPAYSHEPSNIYSPKQGFWGLSALSGTSHERALFKLLPVGSKLIFKVKLDGLTTPAMAKCSLHGDFIELSAHKGKQNYCVHLDSIIGQHNTARFGWNY